MIKNVAISQVLERIRFENNWWRNKKVEDDFSSMPPRAYFKRFYEVATRLEVHRAVVLMGPRRVGKTVMLYHLVQQLLNEGYPARRILFITVENPIYNQIGLDQLFKLGIEAAGAEGDTSGWYVIFDEIQYLKEWDVHLKSLMESYRGSRFIVSGSAAAALAYKSKESGAGRFTDFMLPPLTFYEFIEMQKLSYLIGTTTLPWGKSKVPFYSTHDVKELNRLFLGYMNYGGYPEAIFSEAVRSNPERFIRSDVIDKVLLKDLPGLYGISDVQELNALFTTIAYNTANEFSLEIFSKQSGTPKNTLKNYLDYLEAAYLIRRVKRIDQSGRRFQRENFFKLYLTNPSIRAALFSPLEATDEAMGSLTETAIFAQWMHRFRFIPYYARWANGEVDMVGIGDKNLKPVWALEIKWSDRYATKPAQLKSLVKFCKENALKQALVTTITIQAVVEYEGIEFTFIPAAAYAYTIGANTLHANLEYP
jgi:hypothetical protein